MAGDVELKAVTSAKATFLLWPKFTVSKDLDEELGRGSKKKKNLSVLAVKLNVPILRHFVGYATLYKQLRHVDFLLTVLLKLDDFWEVP